jgi:hypothetical protein
MIEAVLTSALTKEGLSAAIKEAILPDFLKSAENSFVKSFDKADLPLMELQIQFKVTARELNNNSELKDFEKEKIEKQSPYSDEINKQIKSEKELNIYKDAGLTEKEINNNKCLCKDLDYEQKDQNGFTNTERMKMGIPPYDKEGKLIELHHIGQNKNAPLAELTKEEHIGKKNNTILHDTTLDSDIDRQEFNKTRREYWKARAEEIENINK